MRKVDFTKDELYILHEAICFVITEKVAFKNFMAERGAESKAKQFLKNVVPDGGGHALIGKVYSEWSRKGGERE